MLGLRDTAEVTKPDGFEYYHYAPSMAAAILFIVLFAISTSVHMAQMIRSRTWFMIPFVIGGVLETVGYIGRALSANETKGEWTLGPYIIQTLMTLIAPAFLAASIYMELGRIVIMINGEKVLFIRRAWLTKIFVGGDVLSFLMQASGGGMMSGDSISSINTGQTLVVAGLFVQVVFFGLFLIAAGLFHFRILQMPTTKSYELAWWKKHMLSLYVVSGLIFVRSTVRVVEYLQGFDGYIMTHEAFIYVFDATLMIIAVVIMNVIHPGEVAKEVRAAKSGRLEDKDGVGMNLMSA
ncbi:hypothetical protein LTR56_001090 [Elasticomyces elasticus]|nr:hypothetical protein LTR56_001090 [Elasticomyces elasticus]KAK3663491.1 hypothetical protein LTR22_005662 [Elasticomyces elasticus]KAK4927123.1 hypothetical protein LTR49_006039 [Elasticomyces elasticus]KAK5769012.1 hypothetical protein LTS12_000725 [Elasticomyces elasticus]